MLKIKRLLSLIFLICFTTCVNAKVKPGSGDLIFNEDTVRQLHIYFTTKLNAASLKQLGVSGFSFNYSDTTFYANHFLIKNKKVPSVFQWDREGVNLGPEKGLCSSPSCEYFAKKNKIVWNKVNKKISRDISLVELKKILQNLGHYKNSTPQGAATSSSNNSYSMNGERPIALSWDGYTNLIAGTISFNETNYKGSINLQLPNNDGNCEGTYTLKQDMTGTWAILCSNRMGASGSLNWTNNGSVTGSGIDQNNQKVKFTVSP